jgi:hypothetical protein
MKKYRMKVIFSFQVRKKFVFILKFAEIFLGTI